MEALYDLLSGGNEDSDIDELNSVIFTELKALMHIVPEQNATPMDVRILLTAAIALLQLHQQNGAFQNFEIYTLP